tara:strand:+ start:218 stop:1207 length:990 start_codon:yes stop_codon:yes gene_type:complete
MAQEVLLNVENLVVSFDTDRGKITPVNGVSFQVKRGKTLAIVGESGCGKSVTSLSIMGLIPGANGKIEGGAIEYDGQDLLKFSGTQMRKLRGDKIAMIFQEPMTALNPVYTIGNQIMEVYKLHREMSKKEAFDHALAMLEKVKIPDPKQRMREYPHQLSGGMRQRVMIAMSLACNPDVLIADEPTTALDVTIQAQVLDLMKDLQTDLGTSVIFITHDLGVVAEVADDVVVMYAGDIIERGTVFDIFKDPKHPYTQGLLDSLPKSSDTKNEELQAIKGMVPSLFELPKGCRFKDRCALAEDACGESPPELEKFSDTHEAACFVTSRNNAA